MQKKIIALAIASALTAPAAFAADANDVTLYGVIDAAVRSTSNINAAGSSYNGFSQGLFNGSRFGIKGSESIDGGIKAIYKLEAGFTLGTGATDQQGQLFGREAWVGLKDSTMGTLTLGRQYGNFSDAIGTGDVFGERHGNLVYSANNGNTSAPNQGDSVAENGFMYQEMGYRYDNSILYTNQINSIKFGLMHSFSGQTTTAPNNSGNTASMNAVSAGYVSDAINFTAGYQIEGDQTGKKHKNAGFGANYMYGEKNGVYALYFQSKYDAGFTRIGLGTNSTFGGTQAQARKDNIYSLSANYYATSNINLIGALYHDSATNLIAAGDSGARNGVLATADYYFSKRTDAYLMAAHTAFSGALIGNPNGGNGVTVGGAAFAVAPGASGSVNTVMLGLRHRF